jgi:tRNA modification GTPase
MAEIHTLGCPPLLDLLARQLCQDGARLAGPGEFTLRAFLAGRLDLPQAEAVLGVIDAHDQRQLHVALTQLAGGLSHDLQRWREQLLNLLADVEAGLDFVDEAIEFISPQDVASTLHAVELGLQELCQRVHARTRVDPRPRIVLRGQPNVGKSTLWNALLRHDAALVSAQPGTTRDYLEAVISLQGHECRVIDAAGIDPALASGIDHVSQAMTHVVSREADLVVLCLDASRPLEPWELRELWQTPPADLIVLNKIDGGHDRLLQSLPAEVQVEDQPDSTYLRWTTGANQIAGTPERRLIKVSGLRGTGLDHLEACLGRRIQQRSAEECGLVAGTAARCRESLRLALQAVGHAAAVTAADQGQELLAAEIRVALEHLGEVLGTVTTDDLLDRIFSRFCIGK